MDYIPVFYQEQIYNNTENVHKDDNENNYDNGIDYGDHDTNDDNNENDHDDKYDEDVFNDDGGSVINNQNQYGTDYENIF